MGITNEDRAILEAYITPDVLEERKRDYRMIKDRVAEKYGDPNRFYDEPITEDRKKELCEWVAMKRKVNPLSELKNKYKDLDKMNDEFNRVFGEWISENPQWENARLRSQEKRKEVDIMIEYLMKEKLDREDTAKVKDIILWSQLAEPTSFSAADLEKVRQEHLEKLERYRGRKDWESWIEHDELDLEGDRIIAEIKNYKAEYFYKVSGNFM